jgi:aspartyl-tRNA(Asn)/glutamyl-tRNA(Gln) amidotransferase subunit C
MDVTKDTINHLALLARLNLDEQEKEELTDDLRHILDFVDQLQEVDTDGIAPLIFLTHDNGDRSDTAVNELSNQEALLNAPEKKDGFFVVPKVIK